MKTKEGFMPAYNVQSTVDNKHHMLAQLDVTDDPNDYYHLAENIESLEEQIGIVPEEVLADKGYANEDQIKNLEQNDIQCIVPFPEQSLSQKQAEFGISFTYDIDKDCFYCSQGQTLFLIEKRRMKKRKFYAVYQGQNCNSCPLKSKCTTSKKGRIIHRRLDDDWLRSYKAKLTTPDYIQKCKNRKKYVEHPFGTIKYWMGKIPLFLRGKEKVQSEIDLYATCYNLKRLMNIEPMDKLMRIIVNCG